MSPKGLSMSKIWHHRTALEQKKKISKSAQVMVQRQDGSTLFRRTCRAGADPNRTHTHINTRFGN